MIGIQYVFAIILLFGGGYLLGAWKGYKVGIKDGLKKAQGIDIIEDDPVGNSNINKQPYDYM